MERLQRGSFQFSVASCDKEEISSATRYFAMLNAAFDCDYYKRKETRRSAALNCLKSPSYAAAINPEDSNFEGSNEIAERETEMEIKRRFKRTRYRVQETRINPEHKLLPMRHSPPRKKFCASALLGLRFPFTFARKSAMTRGAFSRKRGNDCASSRNFFLLTRNLRKKLELKKGA